MFIRINRQTLLVYGMKKHAHNEPLDRRQCWQNESFIRQRTFAMSKIIIKNRCGIFCKDYNYYIVCGVECAILTEVYIAFEREKNYAQAKRMLPEYRISGFYLHNMHCMELYRKCALTEFRRNWVELSWCSLLSEMFMLVTRHGLIILLKYGWHSS